MTTEGGLRAEAPTQTALTALWRNRKTVLALVGGKCRACGTPQFPAQDVCVNPTCGEVDSQDDVPVCRVTATVKSFTGDSLAVSPDPPAIYGMIEFEGGGRFIADFTDCTLEDVDVGLPREDGRSASTRSTRSVVSPATSGRPCRRSPPGTAER